MNFLAHIFLSGDEEELLVGNFIADAVKGKQAEQFSPGIARGIRLHRLIDSYTDTHPVVGESKARLRAIYRKYAPVVADMYYDHFLAANFDVYSPQPLLPYTQQKYAVIQQYEAYLPAQVQHMFRYMQRDNWLHSYAEVSGIGQALAGISRRTSFASGMETAGEELQKNYALYAAEFKRFFPELMTYVAETKLTI